MLTLAICMTSYRKEETNATKKSSILSLMTPFRWSQCDPKFWAFRKKKVLENNLAKSGPILAESEFSCLRRIKQKSAGKIDV